MGLLKTRDLYDDLFGYFSATGGLKSTSFIVSLSSLGFNWRSILWSDENAGDEFTSSNHGFPNLSTIISKPNSSKHVFRCGTLAQQLTKVSMIIFSMLLQRSCHSTLLWLNWCLSCSKLHLSPEPCVSLAVYRVEENLLIELFVRWEYWLPSFYRS